MVYVISIAFRVFFVQTIKKERPALDLNLNEVNLFMINKSWHLLLLLPGDGLCYTPIPHRILEEEDIKR